MFDFHDIITGLDCIMRYFTLLLILASFLITGCSTVNNNYSSSNTVNVPTEGSYVTGVYPSAALLSGSNYTQIEADQKCVDAWDYFKSSLV